MKSRLFCGFVLPSFCLYNPHALTYVPLSLFHRHKLRNAHLSVISKKSKMLVLGTAVDLC